MKKQKKISIPLKIFKVDENGFHLSIKAKINGIKSILIIDTGASRSVFDKKQIEKTFNTSSAEASEKLSTGIGNNQLKSETMVIDEIQLGDLKIKKYNAVLIDLSHVNEAYSQIGNKNIDGILGSDIMKKYKAVISYPEKSIYFHF